MRFTRTVRATAIAAAAVALVATSALSASADPDFVPDSDDIVLVGSDTSEFVLNDLAALYNDQAPTKRLASFDATGSAQITLRAGQTPVNRPNGSGAGITALCSNPSVSAARSSSGPSSSNCAGLVFLPFAKDSLRWMANDDVTGITSLTDAQLTKIYSCPTDGSADNWNDFGGPNLPIVPLIPQLNSGTRNFWATQVGINATTPPSCVKDNVGGQSVQEHDPALVSATAGAIAPVSFGRWDLLTPAQKVGNFRGAIPTPDSNAYDRNLYQVVKSVGGAVPADLADLFGDGDGFSSTFGTPFICEDADSDPSTATAGDVITDNGFLPLGSAENGGTCGVVS